MTRGMRTDVVRAAALAGMGAAAVLLGACSRVASSPTSTATPAPPPATTGAATATPAAAATTAVTVFATRNTTAAATAVAAPGPYDPCKLLDQVQVEEAAGQRMDAGTRNDMTAPSPLGQSICTWASSTVPVRIVQVSVIRQQDFAGQLKSSGYTVQKLYNDTKATMSDARAVPGIGDEAYRTRSNLYVRKGSVTVQVDVSSGRGETASDVLIGLARTTLQRLGA